MHNQPWTAAHLVAFDLEGTGSQDRDDEAILEVGAVPLRDGRTHLQDAYHSIVNPGRHIPRRPWSSPGLTNDVLASAPSLEHITPELTARLDGAYIVGHNVHVDWRLLSLRCPGIRPAGLIDTLKLARRIHEGKQPRSLTALLDRYQLTNEVTQLVGGQPHRALWDAAGAGLLLGKLLGDLPGGGALTVVELRDVAGSSLGDGGEQSLPLF
ncbi:3'-5' exonuclease [Streptosporangium sp. NBC_01495]|uniref:3'-5' exonuclease n=1 Tax=Streptosporangium sp. NBC_01495 TaxID=2903899 RepID=UPI002E2F24EA|nr:3'-5' exonuclease [Streptosporangium sp. NBC_01495]